MEDRNIIVGNEYLKLNMVLHGIHYNTQIVEQKYRGRDFNKLGMIEYNWEHDPKTLHGNIFQSSNGMIVASVIFPAYGLNALGKPVLNIRGEDFGKDTYMFEIKKQDIKDICFAVAEYNYMMKWWEHERTRAQ
jgi:hypothetical protein